MSSYCFSSSTDVSDAGPNCRTTGEGGTHACACQASEGFQPAAAPQVYNEGSGKPASAQSIASNSTPLLSSNHSAKKAHVAFTTFPMQTILAFKFLGRGRQSWFPRLQLKHCPPIAISQLWCPSQSTTWASPPRRRTSASTSAI